MSWKELRQGSAWRPLREDEVKVLRLSCSSSAGTSFANVGVLKRESSGFDASRVVGCHFGGKLNVLGANRGSICACHEAAGGTSSCSNSPHGTGSGGGGVGGSAGVGAGGSTGGECQAMLPAGLYYTAFSDVVVIGNARVSQCSLLAFVVVEAGAWVDGCGSLSRGGHGGSFGNGTRISLGNSTGGRDIHLSSDLTFEQVCHSVCDPSSSSSSSSTPLNQNVAAAIARAKECEASIIGQDCRVLRCTRLEDFVLGPGTIVERSDMYGVTTLSANNQHDRVRVGEGSVVTQAMLQWGVTVDGASVVEQTLLCEHSHVHRHAKVNNSVIGPCSGVAEGECSHSLLGPLVGFHHQALLIAAVWPDGKGNIGHGASVGSNHTGKLPDQEMWPGEGIFFGLHVCIKYPSSYVDAPYSIIAAGVKALPERVVFPFSLINSAGDSYEGISPALNEIMPAWVLSDSIYTIMRNEGKFHSRFTARRSCIEFDTFRPIIVDKMLTARRLLQGAEGKAVKRGETQLFLDAQIPGLGKNYMTERSRQTAIQAYTRYIRHYALLGLLRELQHAAHVPVSDMLRDVQRSPSGLVANERWAHEVATLLMEFPEAHAQVPVLAVECVASLKRVAKDCEVSRHRDHERGVRITPHYNQVHVAAAEDGVVLSARERVEKAMQVLTARGITVSRL